MRTECRVYSNPNISFKINSPSLVRSERQLQSGHHTLAFVYPRSYEGLWNGLDTAFKLFIHGGRVYQVSGMPVFDYMDCGFGVSILEIRWINVGRLKASVRLEKKGYSRMHDSNVGHQR